MIHNFTLGSTSAYRTSARKLNRTNSTPDTSTTPITLGFSYVQQQYVSYEIATRLPASMELAIAALAISIPIAIMCVLEGGESLSARLSASGLNGVKYGPNRWTISLFTSWGWKGKMPE